MHSKGRIKWFNPDNPNEFFEFTQDQERNYNLNTIIESINKQKLNNLKSFSIKGDGFRISFDRELYNNTIQLNENDEFLLTSDFEEHPHLPFPITWSEYKESDLIYLMPPVQSSAK